VKQTEAERLRACREIFERAQRDNVSMGEARKRIALDRVAEKRRAIEQLRTRTRELQAGQHRPVHSDAVERPRPWWDRD